MNLCSNFGTILLICWPPLSAIDQIGGEHDGSRSSIASYGIQNVNCRSSMVVKPVGHQAHSTCFRGARNLDALSHGTWFPHESKKRLHIGHYFTDHEILDRFSRSDDIVRLCCHLLALPFGHRLP